MYTRVYVSIYIYVHMIIMLYTRHYDNTASNYKVKVAQSCPTHCNPVDYTVHEFSRPQYWSGWPFPSPGDLPNPGTEPRSPTLQADSLPAEPQGK